MKKGTTTPTVRTKQCPEQDPIQQMSSVSANPTKHPSLPEQPQSISPCGPSWCSSTQSIYLQAVCGKGKGTTRSSSTSYACCQETKITSERHATRQARAAMTIFVDARNLGGVAILYYNCRTMAQHFHGVVSVLVITASSARSVIWTAYSISGKMS
jgi:hypothetical protein